MTRRDYELVADTIRQLPLADTRREVVAIAFADSFAAQTGTRFNRWKFLQRCGCLRLVLEASLDENKEIPS